MILSVILIIVAIVTIVMIFTARAKNKDSNGPMHNN